LRADRRFADMALIALTGWGTAHDKQEAIDAGFDSHLTKPVDSSELHGALANIGRMKRKSRDGLEVKAATH
jgi:CheY-like chemotaxis protein